MSREELNRIIELLLEKEQWTDPDCCDPREAGLPYWDETKNGKELNILMTKRKFYKETERL